MKILLAYDASPAAGAALEEITRRPWPQGTVVHVVSVLELPVAIEPPFEAGYSGPLLESILAERRKAARRHLDNAVEKLKAKTDLKVTQELREGGGVKRELLAAIEQWHPDLVMAGFQGKNALERLFPGSVCHALVNHAPCNVEVVKPPPA